jgi:Sulfotransferase family
VTSADSDRLPPPVLILACPRSFTSVVCAMLGQHPQMYALPETHLFCEETLKAWLDRAARAPWPMADGLLRAVAQLYFGGQDAGTVRKARGWLNERAHLPTDQVFQLLASAVYPAVLIDKSPSTVNNWEIINRTYSKFPRARFIHLLRHPRGYCESVLNLIGEKVTNKPIPPTHWLLKFASANLPGGYSRDMADNVVLDPQDRWYARNHLIREFLKSVPASQQMVIRGEDLLASPGENLQAIAGWMGLRTDTSTIEKMTHPERSPYSFLGPPGARFGNDGHFLSDPSLRISQPISQDLEGALSWRKDGQGFYPRVKALAQGFGYT